MIYDLIVLGGGPAGYRAAEHAGQHGMRVLLIEERSLGGVCLNEGCIPTKTLLYSAKLYDGARFGKAYGVTAESIQLDHGAVVARKNKVVKTLVSGVAMSMKQHGVTVVYGKGQLLSKSAEGFSVSANGETYIGKNALVATGSHALVPPIPGLKEALAAGIAMTNREILDLKEVPASLCVIGGGVIGLEMASYFASAGAKVSVVEMLDKIGGQTDSEIAALLQKHLEQMGVTFHLGAKVTKLSGGTVYFESKAGNGEVSAEKVLVSIGRRANTEGIGLEALGAVVTRQGLATDEFMKTSVPGLFAAGDVNGKSLLAHTAYREAEVAVNVMLGKKDRMDYSAVPSVIYTNPEISSVGETEETAKAKGLSIETKKLSLMYSGRYVAENEGGQGIAKFVFEKDTRRLLGISMIGNPSSEIIFGAAAFIGRRMRAEEIQKIIFPHPTVGEVIREAMF
ncbi:MAG TPA: dihydrolipoyl dehydrogenase [Clostridiales bacterium]|nr:dihydrolipoyl dehydrogenase [Clostridiales bacterium]